MAAQIAIAVLYFAIFYIALGAVTLVFFLAIMHLKPLRDTLPPIPKAIGTAVYSIGWVLDFAFNLASTIPFADLPRELLFTGRVSRLKKKTGIRSKVSHWICANVLEPFDKGHCK
jgi:hypothetical protein